MIRRTIPVSIVPRHLRTGLLRRIAMDRMPGLPWPLNILYPAPSDRRVPRLLACDGRRMAGLPPLPASLRTTPAPSEHEIADAYHAHPYPHGRWGDAGDVAGQCLAAVAREIGA